jgi:hypothetical protein
VSNIPAARAELVAIAEELRAMRHPAEAARILAVVTAMMHREKPKLRLGATQEVAEDMAAYLMACDGARNPALPLVAA